FMPSMPTDLVCKDVTTGEIVPCPTFQSDKPAVKPSPSPKAPPANTGTKTEPPSNTTVKPLQSDKAKPPDDSKSVSDKPPTKRSGKPSSPEE
ncbi:MAG: hypothetical protein IT173_11415, partial [Acidobacteria bacterium]|nr:hypothetical protein [Acidobacteriota bacterium]